MHSRKMWLEKLFIVYLMTLFNSMDGYYLDNHNHRSGRHRRKGWSWALSHDRHRTPSESMSKATTTTRSSYSLNVLFFSSWAVNKKLAIIDFSRLSPQRWRVVQQRTNCTCWPKLTANCIHTRQTRRPRSSSAYCQLSSADNVLSVEL